MVQMTVTDIEVAKHFYCQVLGLTLEEEYLEKEILVLKNEGPTLVIHKGSRKASIQYPHEAQSLIIFSSENLDRDILELKEKGVKFLSDSPFDASVGRFIAFEDPFGNVHELLESNKK